MEETEIRICNGVKVFAKYFKSGTYHSNLYKDGNLNTSDKIMVKSKITDSMKQKINSRLLTLK